MCGLRKISWLIVVFVGLLMEADQCKGSESEVGTVKFLKTPLAISNVNSATFAFQVLEGGNATTSSCANCTTTCKLDDTTHSNCDAGEVSFAGLLDGNHTFEVCTTSANRVDCNTYNWIIDTIRPTAYVTASTSFTNAPNVSVNVSFSELCWTGGGFSCDSVNACSLLVYGSGQVIPSTFKTIEPNLKFSVMVSLSSSVQYGRVVLVMDTNFCRDRAGNNFMRTQNSSFLVHFDRRSVFVDLRTHVPEWLLQLNGETRTVQATNKYKNLKVYLYFTEPVLNSSSELLNSLHASQGSLVPVVGDTLGNRRFGFQFINISSKAIVTVTLDSSSVVSRQGNPVSPIAPVTFLYDSQRPSVSLSTTSNMRTRQNNIHVLIKFMKPVFDFNSSHLSISGGSLQSFHEASRSIYVIEVQPHDEMISVNVPENMTADVAGNRNLPSNTLRVRHYSVPMISLVPSSFATAAFVVTALVAGFLTVSTASLRLAGAFPRLSSPLNSDPARNLFRIACHIQIFALSRWLAVPLPVEYYEFAKGLQWSIPYMNLPWENCHIRSAMVGSSSGINPHSYSSKIRDKEINLNMNAAVYGLPLTAMEYLSFFESQNIKPEAEYLLDSNSSHGWRDFERSMFWLALIGVSLILLHVLLILTLRLRKGTAKEKSYGALTFMRFEILLLILALPCICEASTTLIQGGSPTGYIVGILLLGTVSFLVLALVSFLSIGISFGKLLQYKEVHQVGQEAHWYQELVRVTLGPGKRGQWTWKSKPDSVYLTVLGPLYEDLRGPPKYMLSQFVGENSNTRDSSRIIASDDETEDAEAPFIQKLFGILRIYYTFLESIRRVCLGIMAGVYAKSWSSRTPTVILLCLTSFQLFFMVLKKPFIKKKVQLVEIISVSCELGTFALCLVLLGKGTSSADHETKIGIAMISLFLLAFLAQMMNEWYALYRQTKQLDGHKQSFLSGLKLAFIGFVLLFVPLKWIKNLESSFPSKHIVETDTRGEVPNYLDRLRSSGKSEKPWLKQLRELAKASFSREDQSERPTPPSDPSTSQARWSGFWSKRSGSSSVTSSMDSKSRPKGLYKDLEAIFGNKGDTTSFQSR